ncbi:hypothetical protein T11_9661 [Trichinella zimbabwensis]|uniref:Uncharacterized protein n=1 Tax=Trichinella zimbabwensis TaxID=268475 RepID=A0A0V1H535_9BILA|nr:hypothetical protein T11_9661 [Trichinella zimbabwensis]
MHSKSFTTLGGRSSSFNSISVFLSTDTDQISLLGILVVPGFTHGIRTVYRNYTSSVFTRTPWVKQEVHGRLCLRNLLRKQYSFATGRVKIPLAVFTWTVLDNPSLPGITVVILPSGQFSLFMLSSLTSTMSPSFGSCRFVIHFVRLTKVVMYSLLHLFQKWNTICCRFFHFRFNDNFFSSTVGAGVMGISTNGLPIKK